MRTNEDDDSASDMSVQSDNKPDTAYWSDNSNCLDLDGEVESVKADHVTPKANKF